MQGVDSNWQTVGHRTEAVYTNLKPAEYHFLVKASYGDGTWTHPVELSFQVVPAFYETWWFASLCVLLGALLLTTAVWLRLRFLANKLRERAEQRADERIRIARDLHDTLLQGVQGLLMSFHVAAQSIPEDSKTRNLMERALQSADRLLVEGRNRVSDLRGEDFADRADLLTSLRRAGQELDTGDQRLFQAMSQGNPCLIAPPVFEELFFVGREALTNAFRHSGATTIEISLQYGPKSFVMISRDNGRGMRSGTPTSQADRWGIRGMVERVQRLGGTCRIESSPASGTTVTVSVPARKTYTNTHTASGFWASVFRRMWP